MLVDTFMFFNELDVLETRLRKLSPRVDLFVLVESAVTHNGSPKPLFFEQNKERYAEWLPKIRHVIASDMPTDENPWSREKHQRSCILQGLEGVPDDAWIMVSDADEIPMLDKVPWGDIKSAHTLHMYMFEYSLKYMFQGEPWFGTVVTRGREFRALGPNFFRDNRWRFPHTAWAGWHLSSFGDARHVWNKIQNYAHAKDAKHQHQSFEDFKLYLEQGLHSDGQTKLIPTPPEVPLP
jgi:beta-1,4-mannosyl-glycoprotein beta-1,4-N-acetylglucosaminyltransferase